MVDYADVDGTVAAHLRQLDLDPFLVRSKQLRSSVVQVGADEGRCLFRAQFNQLHVFVAADLEAHWTSMKRTGACLDSHPETIWPPLTTPGGDSLLSHDCSARFKEELSVKKLLWINS